MCSLRCYCFLEQQKASRSMERLLEERNPDRHMAQEVSRQPLTAEARVRVRYSPCLFLWRTK
jgi:hypothetical protein